MARWVVDGKKVEVEVMASAFRRDFESCTGPALACVESGRRMIGIVLQYPSFYSLPYKAADKCCQFSPSNLNTLVPTPLTTGNAAVFLAFSLNVRRWTQLSMSDRVSIVPPISVVISLPFNFSSVSA